MLDRMDAQARGGTLILGGGFAGSYVAKLLKQQGATIVSPENFMLFASMLPEAASGTLEPRHVVVPLRMMCPHADLVLGRAVAHDAERQRVQVETEAGLVNLTYRNLVVALGAIPRTLPIPGLAEHAFGFKDLADAALLYSPPHVGSAPRHWVLLDGAPKILRETPPRLGDYAAEQLLRRGV